MFSWRVGVLSSGRIGVCRYWLFCAIAFVLVTPPATEPAHSGAARALLVDDDWICREVGQELLRVRGIAVTTVSSGREALDLIESETFDLVLLDLHMPNMAALKSRA